MLQTQTMTAFFHDPAAPILPDQFEAEFSALLDLFDQRKPRRILEIGVREGGSLYQWIKHAEPGAEIVAIDLPGAMWGHHNTGNTERWLQWAADRGVNLSVYLSSSHDPEIMLKVVKEHAPFDFVFIDGDHSLEGLVSDFLAFGNQTHGIIALHDILPDITDSRIEGWKLWRILRPLYTTDELISDDDQTSRGIGVIYV